MTDKIIEYYEKGLMVREIAARLDLKYVYVYNVLNKYVKQKGKKV